MRILVISDIHGNLNALEAVLKDAGRYEKVWCLGDIVGYGPDPNECVATVKALPELTCLLGNHDAAVLGQIALQAFNQDAQTSLSWTKSKLKSSNLNFLAHSLEKTVVDNVTLVHGAPRNPVWEYLLDMHTAEENFPYFETEVCLVGHTHIPIMFSLTKDDTHNWEILEPGRIHKIKNRCFLNPGSVGQPRDHDPRAAYAIYDPERSTWQPMRVTYDIESVQKKIDRAGLPRKHGARLSNGW